MRSIRQRVRPGFRNSGVGSALFDFLKRLSEIYEFRELFLELVRRDLLVRYKQTLIGVGWAVIAPFLAMLVFTMVFTRAVSVETEVPYPIFAYSGLLAWNLLASSLRSATTSLTANRALVTKVRFPRELLPLSTITVSLVDFLVASLLLVGLMVYYGIYPGWTILLLPVVLVVELVFIFGLALILALGNLFYRDVGFIFGLVLSLWMFLTSVVYPVEIIGGRLASVLALNPMNSIILAFRGALLGGPLPDLTGFYISALCAVLFTLTAMLLFHRVEPQFAEAI